MSEESAKEFMKLMEEDPGFKRAVKEIQTKEDVKRVVLSKGFNFSEEEFLKVYREKVGHELSEEELALLSSGGSTPGCCMAQINATE